jgi:gliding motility-associated-like protein
VTYSSGNTAVVTITDGGDVHIVGAGSVTITASSGGTSISQTVVVNPAPLTIAAGDQTRTFGADNPALTLTYTGFVYSDDAASLTTAPAVTTTAGVNSNVGGYPITVSGAADPNYSITYAAGNLSVTPAALTITADNQTKAQGAAIPVLTVTYTGFVNNNTADDLTSSPVVETTALTDSDPGTYPITVSGAADPNYTITYVSGTLTILPPPTLVANNILTPNGDGVNDVWIVHDIQFYPDNIVAIYDRAGRQVYSARGYNNDWAGTANGKPLVEGTYYYVLVLKPDLPIIRGFISIIRSK